MLAAESFDPKIDGKLEEELLSKVTGTENLLQATLVSGYTGKLDSNGKLKIVSNNGDEKVDHIVVNAVLYSYVYDMKNKYEYDGTNKFAVSERIKTLQGNRTYYSALGQDVLFYDGVTGKGGTTGINGSLKTITVGDQTYYRLVTANSDKDENIYSFTRFDSAQAPSNTTKKPSMIKVFAYDANNRMIGQIPVSTEEATYSYDSYSLDGIEVGTTVKNVPLPDGLSQWAVNDSDRIVNGKQRVYAVVKSTGNVVPVDITGVYHVTGISIEGVKNSETIEMAKG